jgi:hypothetical protein
VYTSDEFTTRAYQWETYVRATDVPYPMQALAGDDWLSRFAFRATATVYGGLGLVQRAASALFGRTDDYAARCASETNPLGQPMWPLKADVDTEWTEEIMAAVDEWNRRSHSYGENYAQRIIFSKNIRFLPNVVNGKIHVNDAGISKIEGRRVHFEDRESREYDAVVLCTGFVKDFSVYGPDVAVDGDNVRNLYKHAFYPEHDGRLALIGFVRPFTGGIPVCAEMQARYFAQLCSGKLRLPGDVRARIAKDKAWEERWTNLSPRHTEAIPAQALFMDSLAKEIGCLVSLPDLIRSPRLFLTQWYSAFNQASYRIVGPHSLREEALAELESQGPYPFANALMLLYLMVTSILPSFVRVKHTTSRLGTPPGYPAPPKTGERRQHFLSTTRARGSATSKARTKSSDNGVSNVGSRDAASVQSLP